MYIQKWKTILINNEITNYSVSNYGNIKNDKTGKLLKINENHSSGYCVVRLYHNNKKYDILVHRLVATYFCKNPYNKKLVNHKNGNKKQNNHKNLEWSTNSENIKHAYDNNLIKKSYGEKSHCNKFSEKFIREICKLMEEGYSNKEITLLKDIKKSMVTDLRNKRTWANIVNEYDIPKSKKVTTFSEEQIHQVCRLLENGKSIINICNEMGLQNTQKYTDAIKGIKYKKKFKYISKQYKF